MKTVKVIVLLLLVVFIGLQFIPTKLNQSKNVLKTDFLLINNTPRIISTTLQKSCYDCHSNNTNYPWYNKIQPAAWFLESHVQQGKKELDFSKWAEYSNRRKKSKLKSIVSQIRDNKMPLSSYTFIHSDAKLSKEEKENITGFINKIIDSL